MKQYALQGIWHGKSKITTKSRDDQKRADDLVNRNFSKPKDVIHHSNRGVGTTGDSYNNALAETVNELYKT